MHQTGSSVPHNSSLRFSQCLSVVNMVASKRFLHTSKSPTCSLETFEVPVSAFYPTFLMLLLAWWSAEEFTKRGLFCHDCKVVSGCLQDSQQEGGSWDHRDLARWTMKLSPFWCSPRTISLWILAGIDALSTISVQTLSPADTRGVGLVSFFARFNKDCSLHCRSLLLKCNVYYRNVTPLCLA